MSKRPNILFIMTDQQKATSLDLYSSVNAIPTTSLKELANEGTTFETCYCPYPLCVPSRISMLTGRYPSNTGHVGNHPDMNGQIENYETVFSAAKNKGYRTFLVGKDHAYGVPNSQAEKTNRTRWDAPDAMSAIFDDIYHTFHGPFMTHETNRDQPHVEKWLQETDVLQTLWGSAVAPWDGEDSVTAKMCDVTVDYLKDWKEKSSDEDTPFAMWLSFPDPHEFYQAPKDVYDSIDPASVELYPNWESDIENRAEYIQFMHWYFNNGDVPEELAKELIRVYLAMCKNVDIQLNKVFDQLKAMGEWENTIILYTSDHGDFTGEHQLLQKFNAGYDGCCRVPLIMAWPGKSIQDRRSKEPVNLADIPATLCDLLGWETFSKNQGISFADALLDEAPKDRKFTVVESGLYGENLTTADIKNFSDHRYDISPDGRWCYDPPHRFGGRIHAVRSKRYKLIVRQDQKCEFYDMISDPWETTNIFDRAELKEEIQQHHLFLIDHLSRIAPTQEGVAVANTDKFYRAGGEKTWAESLADERAKKQ